VGFTDSIRKMLLSQVGEGKAYPNKKRMADALNVDPSQLNRFLDGERSLSAITLGRLLDGLDARIVLPGSGDSLGEATPKGSEPANLCPVHFVTAHTIDSGASGSTHPPESADYIAVPLASECVAAAPGHIPDTSILGWVLMWRQHESVRFRTDMVAVKVSVGDHSMAPTLHPEDILLVDRAERTPDPAGKIMFVRHPNGECALRRVATRPVDGDMEIIFYSDNNKEFPPTVYRLQRDYNNDLTRAVVGRVIWAWNDMTHK